MAKHKISKIKFVFVAFIICLTTPISVFADNSKFYKNNDIFFYNSTDGCSSSSPSTSIDPNLSGFDRLKAATKQYGEYAMEMEREYGTPWEVVIAQMQKESSVGTAGIAVDGADNNWLGITGKGDAGSWISSTGREWAKYSNVEGSIKDWAGPRILRNGMYDSAFKYLDPNNYNIDSFLSVMLSVYAPSSDNNNDAAYKADVLSFINGPIAEVEKEQNWPSSAELAKKDSIAIGGQNPISSGSLSKNNSSVPEFTTCYSSTKTGNQIADTAIGFVNDDGSLNQNYAAAAKDYAPSSDGYTDCGLFVGTVMRVSGSDTSYPQVGTDNQLAYVKNHPEKYQLIPFFGKSDSELQPGDILLISSGQYGHTSLWTGSQKKLASASENDFVPKYISSASWFSQKNDSYIVRLK